MLVCRGVLKVNSLIAEKYVYLSKEYVYIVVRTGETLYFMSCFAGF